MGHARDRIGRRQLFLLATVLFVSASLVAALVDELAHMNVAEPDGMRNAGRTSSSLFDNGIAVITTVNIQHLERLADDVEHTMDVAVPERVPDSVVRPADQAKLVDFPPEQPRERMLHGNVYPPGAAFSR